MPALHHVELWVSDLGTAAREWGWLFVANGWRPTHVSESARSWTHPDGTYVFVESSGAVAPVPHDRMRPGVNHLALNVADRETLDALRHEAASKGWRELFAEAYPHAGGAGHTALYLENSEGFEVELVTPAAPATLNS